MAKRPVKAVNKHRGEAVLKLGPESYKLCLTMNAIVEIEDATGFAISSPQMAETLRAPSMKHMRAILGALVRGGGHDVSDEALGAQPFDPEAISLALEAAFAASGLFTPGDEAGSAPSPN